VFQQELELKNSKKFSSFKKDKLNELSKLESENTFSELNSNSLRSSKKFLNKTDENISNNSYSLSVSNEDNGIKSRSAELKKVTFLRNNSNEKNYALNDNASSFARTHPFRSQERLRYPSEIKANHKYKTKYEYQQKKLDDGKNENKKDDLERDNHTLHDKKILRYRRY